jgi:type III restriction enzyme
MIYQLKEYQRIAVDKLKRRIELLLEENSKGEIVFKSPTGSGKTFIASSLIEELAEEQNGINFCIIWACPGKGELHKQSFDAVKYYLGGNPVCTLLEDDFFGTRNSIDDKEIVFVNWEKLVQKDKETGKWANNLMKDQEGCNFINVISKTKNKGSKIILIVDESHIGASQKTRISEFRDTIICPDIVLEMSATPLNDHIDVEVESDDVVAEGMIKQDVIVNEGIRKQVEDLNDQDSELLVLEKGFAKRQELKSRFESLGIRVNPLCLIQIPNVDEGEAKKISIKDFLRDKGVTEENGKLKLWCDDAAFFDRKAIKKNDDITEFLIFKTAVATGWDCPRAHILIKFREGKSETFETQTIGRILRTPEAKSYGDYLLDNAYIFTNIKSFEKNPDTYNPKCIKSEWSQMRKPYDRLTIWGQTMLRSFYRSRQGDYNAADSTFSGYFVKHFMDFFGLKESDKFALIGSLKDKLEEKGLNLGPSVSDQIMEETKIGIKNVDNSGEVGSGTVDVRMAENDIQGQYYSIIRENLSGLAFVRSKSPVNSAIIDCLSMFYNVFDRKEKVSAFQKIVVNNGSIFAQLLSESTREFRDKLQENAGKKGDIYDFQIDEARPYSIETHTILALSKSLYQPLYVLKDDQGNPDNGLEKAFLNYINGQPSVVWFWENGTELMRINFGIPYCNGMNTFQPDFLVKFSDGSLGIFDTKPVNYRVEDTTAKANALSSYIEGTMTGRGENPKVFGGIVIQDGTQFYYFEGKEYHVYSQDHSGWKNFNDLFRSIDEQTDYTKIVSDFVKNS